jgi:hypothetical protein
MFVMSDDPCDVLQAFQCDRCKQAYAYECSGPVHDFDIRWVKEGKKLTFSVNIEPFMGYDNA